MSKVYVIQEPRPGKDKFTYDISPCLQYGQPVMVFDKDDLPGMTPGPCLHQARRVLAGITTDDYVLWAGGDPAGFAIVGLVVGEILGSMNFLRWERERGPDGKRTGKGFYVPVRLNLRGKR